MALNTHEMAKQMAEPVLELQKRVAELEKRLERIEAFLGPRGTGTTWNDFYVLPDGSLYEDLGEDR